MFAAEPEATQVMDTAVVVLQRSLLLLCSVCVFVCVCVCVCVCVNGWEVGHEGLTTDLKGFT